MFEDINIKLIIKIINVLFAIEEWKYARKSKSNMRQQEGKHVDFQ